MLLSWLEPSSKTVKALGATGQSFCQPGHSIDSRSSASQQQHAQRRLWPIRWQRRTAMACLTTALPSRLCRRNVLLLHAMQPYGAADLNMCSGAGQPLSGIPVSGVPMSSTSSETSAVSKACAVPDRSATVAFSARLSGSAALAWAAWGSCRMPAWSVVVREVCGLAERWVRRVVAASPAGQKNQIVRSAVLHIKAGHACVKAWTCTGAHTMQAA